MPRECPVRPSRFTRFHLSFLAQILLLTAFTLSAGAQTPTTSSANTPHAARTWHGVNIATRELVLSPDPDLCLGGPMPLCFGRYYASLLDSEGEAVGSLGTNWLGTYDWRFEETALDAKVVDNRGRVYHFINDGSGWTLDYPLDAPWQLTELGDEMSFTHVRHRAFYIIDRSIAKLVRIEDGKGNQHTLSYSRGLLESVSDELGRTLSFAYDPLDRVIEVSDGVRLRVYGYSGANLTSVTDPALQVTTYQYDVTAATPGLLTGWVDPVGNSPLSYSYDLDGRLAQVHDVFNTLATFTVTSETSTESLITVDTPDGGLHQYTHDEFAQLTLYENPANGLTILTYDPERRLTSITRPSGIQPAMFHYDPVDNYLSKVTLGDGTQYEFTAERRTLTEGHFLFPTIVQAPDLSQVLFDYDAVGNLTQITDQENHSWTMTHNAFGQATSITNPTSGVDVLTYDLQGRLETLNDGAGVTTFLYDNLDRLTDVLHPGLSSEIFTYDDRNLLLSYTDELSKTWSYEYRDNGQLSRVTNPLSVDTEFEYDAMNRLIQAGVPAMGSLITYDYDPCWRIQTVTDPTSRALSYEYDQLGRMTKIIDPDGEETTFGYDVDGRLTSRTDPLSHTWSFDYDLRDRLTTLTDPLNQTTTYGYDAVSNLTSVDRPLILGRTYGYDARGLLTSTSLGPITVGYSYTPLGQLDTFTDGEQNPWTRGYDAHGRLQSTTDPLSRTLSFEYDARNRLTDVDHPEGATSYTYDDAGRLIQVEYLGDGTIIDYAYDDVGRLLITDGVNRVYDDLGRVTEENGLTYIYDEAGRLLTETLGLDQVVTHTYDNRGLLSTTTGWLQGTTTFTHDEAGRLSGFDRPNGTSAQYDYDDANRLVGLTEFGQGGNVTNGSVTLTRDALGRVTSTWRQMPHTWGPATTDQDFAYDPASQVIGFNYDGLGRLLDDGLRSYVWDGASLPDSIDDGTETRDMDPDGLGRIKVAMPFQDPTTEYVQFIRVPPIQSAWVLAQVLDSDPPVQTGGFGGRTASNPLAITGGTGAEETTDVESRVPSRLRHRDRAVTEHDFKNLATATPGVRVTRASATPTGPGTDRAHWITTPGGLLLHSIDLRGPTPDRRYFHFDERGNTAFQTNDAGNMVNVYAYSVQGDVSAIGEPQQYPRFTLGGAFGVVQESDDGLYRLGSSFYDAQAPDGMQDSYWTPSRPEGIPTSQVLQRVSSGPRIRSGDDDRSGLSTPGVGQSGGDDWLALLFEVFHESRRDIQEDVRYWFSDGLGFAGGGGASPSASSRDFGHRTPGSSIQVRAVVVLPDVITTGHTISNILDRIEVTSVPFAMRAAGVVEAQHAQSAEDPGTPRREVRRWLGPHPQPRIWSKSTVHAHHFRICLLCED